jgi:hypothetical protein
MMGEDVVETIQSRESKENSSTHPLNNEDVDKQQISHAVTRRKLMENNAQIGPNNKAQDVDGKHGQDASALLTSSSRGEGANLHARACTETEVEKLDGGSAYGSWTTSESTAAELSSSEASASGEVALAKVNLNYYSMS